MGEAPILRGPPKARIPKNSPGEKNQNISIYFWKNRGNLENPILYVCLFGDLASGPWGVDSGPRGGAAEGMLDPRTKIQTSYFDEKKHGQNRQNWTNAAIMA